MVSQPTARGDVAPTAVSMAPGERWQLRLLGGVSARRGNIEIRHWPVRAEVLLLARLALAPTRDHAREELVELLWPGVAQDVGRNRLRQVLSTLRQKLEAGSATAVIAADRQHLHLLPDTLSCDAVQFQELLRQGAFDRARASYGGELMPGYYEEWVLEARRDLAADWERVERAARVDRAERVEHGQRPPVPQGLALPAPWTRAFGMAPSIARLTDLLRSHRLVTILGAGGSGKTRLAIETAGALDAASGAAAAFDRVGFVSLVDCHDAADILQALAHALGLAGVEPLEEARLMLRHARSLLVLDNAEQVIEALRDVVTWLLQAVPGLHLLLTSRRRLHVAGEQLLALGGLPVPAEGDPSPPLRANPAVALFIDRAQGAQPDFGTDEHTLADVAALVRHLGGWPLALELAASRMGSMGAAELLLRLLDSGPDDSGSGHLELLRRDGASEPRHASLDAVLASSWQWLDAAQRRLLAAVSIVAGGADLDLLAAVLQEPPLRVLRMADEAMGQSMLQRLRGSTRTHYTLPEALREFVHGNWPAQDQLQLRIAWVQALTAHARALGASGTGAALKPELPSIHLLLASPTLQREAPVAMLELVLALRTHWESAHMPAKLQDGIEQLLEQAHTQIAPALACAAYELLAYLRFESGYVATARAHAAAALARASGEPALRARALVRRCWITLARHHAEERTELPEVRQALQEALALARAAGDADVQARALHQWGILVGQFDDDWTAAEAAFARAQALWQQQGDSRKAMARLRNRAQCWRHLGRVREAHASLQQTLQAARADDDLIGCIDSLISLSDLLASQRDWTAALAAARECVALCWQHRHRHGLAYALWNPARPLAHLRQPETAMRLMAFAARFWQDSFGPLTRTDQRALRRVQTLVRRQIGATRTAQCQAEGESLGIAQAVELLVRAEAEAEVARRD